MANAGIPAQASRIAFFTFSARDSSISPRNLRVRWIFCASTHFASASAFFSLSWTVLRKAWMSWGRAIAIKVLTVTPR
jgi:hypothetical protein